ncbi:hypothetical protein HYU92_01110 [Candidatus Curtissbacteria bacterium]|nr:hypothetical protein [Candidatus Curtissbacteria bacterium]
MAKNNNNTSARHLDSYATIAQRNFQKDKFVLLVFLAAVISIFLQAAIIVGSWSKLPPEIPLYYSRPWGENVLSPPVGLWLLPGIGLVCLIINFLIETFLISENKFLSRILAIFCFLVALTTLYGTFKIVSLLI